MVLSTGVPSLADKRYFLSQMSSDASWKGIASTSLCSSLTTLFMDGYLSPEVLGLLLRPLSPNREKRKTHSPQVFAGPYVSMWMALSDANPSAPRLPNHQDVATQHLVLGSEA